MAKDDRDGTIERVLLEASRLPLKQRLQLRDALRADSIVERDDMRFSIQTLSEFKRFRKAKPADEPLFAWLASLQPGDVFYDIGANTGVMSIRVGVTHQGRVRVVAFEPAFDNFEALVRNVMANHLEPSVIALQVALTDRTGMQPFHYFKLGAGAASHALGEPVDFALKPFAPAAVQPVLGFRLDDLVAQFDLPQPTHVKIDVDGIEEKVVVGGRKTLGGAVELMVEMAEVAPGDPRAAAVKQTLAELGFALEQVIERRPPGTFPRSFDGHFVRRRSV